LIYKLLELHAQYGDVVRIAPDEVVYIGQEAQKDIYAFGGGSGPFVKSPDFYFSLAGAHSIVTTPSNAEHGKVRKILSSSFSDKAIREQEPAVMKLINLFIQRLQERAHRGPQDLSKWFNLLTFDIIGDLAFGEPFGSVGTGDYHPWVRTMTQNNIWSVLVGSAQRLPLLQPFLRRLIPVSLKEERAQMITYTKDQVARRIPQGSSRTDFMSPLLRAESFSRQELELNAMTFVVAGSDTTASLLSGLTYHLCQNPHVLDKLTAEVRSAFQSDEEINFTSVNSLKYELAVLKEGLRMFPPASAGLPRRVPVGGATVAGEWVPGGVSRIHSTTNPTMEV
jgi:cytochrome P450